MQEPWLIAVDLDDTVLDDIRTLNQESVRALLAAQEAGCQVMIATARPLCITKPHYETLRLHTPVALLNGAHFCLPGDGAFPVQRHYITQSSVQALLGCFPAGAVTAVWLENNDELITTGYYPGSPYFDELYTHSSVTEAAHGQLPPAGAGRLFFWARRQMVDDTILQAARGVKGVELTCRPWRGEDGLLLFGARSSLADKWFCVEQAAAYFGIPLSRVVTFGDEMNDRMMLERAGIGVAMRNANPELLQIIARHTQVSNREGGVGRYLDKLLDLHLFEGEI